MICVDELATVVFPCFHRVYCVDCFNALMHGRNHIRCPLRCAHRVTRRNVYDGTRMQSGPVMIHGDDEHDPSRFRLDPAQFPYGYVLLDHAGLVVETNLDSEELNAIRARCYDQLKEVINDPEHVHLLNDEAREFVTRGVEELLRAKISGNIDSEIITEFMDRLPPMDRESISSELMAKTDLHIVAQCYTDTVAIVDYHAKALIRSFFVAQDAYGYALRAGVSGVVDGVLTGVASSGWVSFNGLFADGISNIFVFAILTGVELYRFSNGEIDAAQLAVNTGEHLLGCGAGIAGGVGGAVVGTMICPVIGTIIGGILGGFLADFLTRIFYRKAVKVISEIQAEAARQQILLEALLTFDIDINIDDYTAAKRKYRGCIVGWHPDRCPRNSSEEEVKEWNNRAAKAISHWQTVRGYYETEGLIPAGSCDAMVKVHILQVYDKVRKTWKTVRTWFGQRMQMLVAAQVPNTTQIVEYSIYY